MVRHEWFTYRLNGGRECERNWTVVSTTHPWRERIVLWRGPVVHDDGIETQCWTIGAILVVVLLYWKAQRIKKLWLTSGERAKWRRKVEFVRRVGSRYGYGDCPRGHIDLWRSREHPALISPLHWYQKWWKGNQQGFGEVYLDHAGAALPSYSQLAAILQLECEVLANPHSSGPAASRTARCIEQVQKRVLDLLDGQPGRWAGRRRRPPPAVATSFRNGHNGYELVWTAGTTGALRAVAERFSWTSCSTCQDQSRFVYAHNSHTSVLGMRAVALHHGATFSCIAMDQLMKDVECEASWLASTTSCQMCNGVHRHLLVLPLECNFTGNRLPPGSQQTVARLQQRHPNWLVMLDIAKAAATGPVSLCDWNADFYALSFYKLFGTPTGLGALLVKQSAVPTLLGARGRGLRRYFGGGSMDVIVPGVDYGVPRSEPSLASLQNGTIHFRGICALSAGLDEVERVGGMRAISSHAQCLAQELAWRFDQLRHANGQPAVVIYGEWANKSTASMTPGPVVAFNLLRSDGTFVGFNEVIKLAGLRRTPIQLRAGCFCNPGACQAALGLSDQDVMDNYRSSGHVCGDQIDIINGRPTGALRASFGKDSIWEDLDALVTFVEQLYVSTDVVSTSFAQSGWNQCPRHVVLSELYVFPIKSCAAQRVQYWQYDALSHKPCFDREFALVDANGVAMRLQAYPKMAFIEPEINLNQRIMRVRAPGMPDLVLQLDDGDAYHDHEISIVKVCGSRCGGLLWGDYAVSDWFSKYMGLSCWLARHCQGAYVASAQAENPQTLQARSSTVAFANEQPLLLISEHAVDALNGVLAQQSQKNVSSRHFRPNFVVRQAVDELHMPLVTAHADDGWTQLRSRDGLSRFEVVGPCARCSMVDVDPSTGLKGNTLRALADYRRQKHGHINFGIFLRGSGRIENSEAVGRQVMLCEGDVLQCE